MNIVLMPQAVKIMLPAIISQCVVALKDTASGYAIVSPGLTHVAKQIYLEFDNQVPTMIVIAGHLHRHQPDPDLARDVGAEEVRRREEAARGADGRQPQRRPEPGPLISSARQSPFAGP